MNVDIRDVHLIKIFKQLGLQIGQDAHLFMVIEEFVREVDRGEKEWVFRVQADSKGR